MTDNVNHPKHYTSHPSGIECIQITEHMNFNLGNAVKYLWRTDHKNGLEDLKKAEFYIKREIQRLETERQKKDDAMRREMDRTKGQWTVGSRHGGECC